jgi:thiamine-phosphate pyrophosphorylase
MTKMTEETLREALKVYFIMGSNNCRQSPAEVLKEAIEGGITIFQFREKGKNALEENEKLVLAKELQTLCKDAGIPFIVNDDIELALSIDADGVHIGQDDGNIEEIRERIGDKILGVSVHDVDEAKTALEKGADYFGVGPIFPTQTKEDTEPVTGPVIFERFRKEGFTIPMVGIGGITPENAKSVIEAGADGVSVISAISLADDIVRATKQLKNQVTL